MEMREKKGGIDHPNEPKPVLPRVPRVHRVHLHESDRDLGNVEEVEKSETETVVRFFYFSTASIAQYCFDCLTVVFTMAMYTVI